MFLPAKDGGIEAVDLATGTLAWTNKDAATLAGASDEMVLASVTATAFPACRAVTTHSPRWSESDVAVWLAVTSSATLG